MSSSNDPTNNVDPKHPAFNQTNTAATPGDQTWNQWVAEFKAAEEQYYDDFATFLKEAATDPQQALMFAMTVLMPDKMVIGQVEMERQSIAIDELSNITNLINQLQNAFQNGDYNGDPAQQAADEQSFTTAYNNLENELNNDPWLKDQSIQVTVPEGISGNIGGSKTFNIAGLLGDANDPSSTLSQLLTELNDFSGMASPAGVQPGPANPYQAALIKAQAEVHNGQGQQYTNDFSEMTQQSGSVSQFQQNNLQYMQQNYTQVTQAVQDILSDVVGMISITTSNESKM